MQAVQPALPAAEPAAPAAQPEGRSFGEMVKDSAREVNRLQFDVDNAAEKVSTGQAEDFHSAMIAVQKASLALDLTIQVRNKAIESYQEIMRMQV